MAAHWAAIKDLGYIVLVDVQEKVIRRGKPLITLPLCLCVAHRQMKDVRIILPKRRFRQCRI